RSPADVWFPSADFIPPEKSWLGELGWQYETAKGLTYSVETYYKKINNILSNLSDTDEGDPLVGEGEAYGVEGMIKKQGGKTGGWFNYTLAWSNRQFPIINDGAAYPYELDSRHQVKLFLFHQLNPHFTLGMNWIYQSALPQTIAPDNENPFSELSFDFNIGPRNNVRSTANHRLDLSLSYQLQQPLLQHQLKLSIYNVYNRKNIAFYRLNALSPENFNLEPIHIMPLMPSLQYRLKF
ncbi:MAG: hypothetical protein AAGD05_06725, partial [Bacteroidota bacterium]